MQRIALAIFSLAISAAAISPAQALSVDSANRLDQARQEHLDNKEETKFDQLRRENLEKSSDKFDQLRRENLEKSSDKFDQLRRENLEKSSDKFDQLRRDHLDNKAI